MYFGFKFFFIPSISYYLTYYEKIPYHSHLYNYKINLTLPHTTTQIYIYYKPNPSYTISHYKMQLLNKSSSSQKMSKNFTFLCRFQAKIDDSFYVDFQKPHLGIFVCKYNMNSTIQTSPIIHPV